MKKETKLWFDLAEDDYKNMLLMIKSKSHRGAVFFAQQSVEKLLKAYIIEYKNFNPKRTHKIEVLMNDAELNIKEIEKSSIEELSKAYTWVRYPDLSNRFYTKKEITDKLLVCAKQLYKWVKNKFKDN